MPPTLSRRSVLRAAVAATATTAAIPLIGSATPRAASATAPGATGRITYLRAGIYYTAKPDGSDSWPIGTHPTGAGAWSPDGDRFFYPVNYQLHSTRANGTFGMDLLEQLPPEVAGDLTVTEDGRYVIFATVEGLRIASTGGDAPASELLHAGALIDSPTVSVNGTLYFEQGPTSMDTRTIYSLTDEPGAQPKQIATNAWGVDVSPDGSRIAFVRSDLGDGYNGKAQIWLADADGSNQAVLTTEAIGAWNFQPKWSPDGTTILFSSGAHNNARFGAADIKKMVLATKAVTTVVPNAFYPSWQPIQSGLVERVWGQTALDTAIATSRYNYATYGVAGQGRKPAQAVVLSRSDTYFDALAGSTLAVDKGAPLLITPREGLPAAVEAEIKRVLGPSGTVYLLGGTAALPPVIESRLRSLGFSTRRVFGNSVFDTAIAVANEIAPSPKTVIVSTALNYYDALAAGAAAGANPGTVIVLTAGDDMPAETAAYLNRIDPTKVDVVAAGGPGARALTNAAKRGQLPSWPADATYLPLVGRLAQDTARLIAETFFTSPRTVAVATVASWYDALTGGAMIGANYGPLLITSPTELDFSVWKYLNLHSASVSDVVLIGGTSALPAALVRTIGEAFSVSGHYTTSETTPETSLKANAKAATQADARTSETPSLRAGKTLVKK
ncbi:cell wall-binding repeat-containing protein [Dactylosporangium sp. NPDC051485]|uniref:cell wall-binding repeat-containing protein n=1 Tax=Dactylosporangium sp. NPDC051485 TaxID=3154846 RepID=UPI00343B4BCF